ncbi:hypothetical protein BV898_16402 [Hypsibius exemplaris]|uniref:RRM domain-containing protein n=1 Tax=Hypsibius exemplaris TaxID=2072580 RepID=A0A9X6ND58_HYPEX|nr:hypothetical protein BV898_16402 [Hypsibius exemplaris]
MEDSGAVLMDACIREHSRKLSRTASTDGGVMTAHNLRESVAEFCNQRIGAAIESGDFLELPKTKTLLEPEKLRQTRMIVICDERTMFAAVTMSAEEIRGRGDEASETVLFRFVQKTYKTTLGEVEFQLLFRGAVEKLKLFSAPGNPKAIPVDVICLDDRPEGLARTLSSSAKFIEPLTAPGKASSSVQSSTCELRQQRQASLPMPKDTSVNECSSTSDTAATIRMPGSVAVKSAKQPDESDCVVSPKKKFRRRAISSSPDVSEAEGSHDEDDDDEEDDGFVLSVRRKAKSRREKSVASTSKSYSERRRSRSLTKTRHRSASSSDSNRRSSRHRRHAKDNRIMGHPVIETDGGHKLRVEFLSGSLSGISESDVKTVFADFGKVKNINIHKNEGFVYVTFKSFSAAKDAGQAVNKMRDGVKGRRVLCLWALPPKDYIGIRPCFTCGQKKFTSKYCDEIVRALPAVSRTPSPSPDRLSKRRKRERSRSETPDIPPLRRQLTDSRKPNRKAERSTSPSPLRTGRNRGRSTPPVVSRRPQDAVLVPPKAQRLVERKASPLASKNSRRLSPSESPEPVSSRRQTSPVFSRNTVRKNVRPVERTASPPFRNYRERSRSESPDFGPVQPVEPAVQRIAHRPVQHRDSSQTRNAYAQNRPTPSAIRTQSTAPSSSGMSQTARTYRAPPSYRRQEPAPSYPVVSALRNPLPASRQTSSETNQRNAVPSTFTSARAEESSNSVQPMPSLILRDKKGIRLNNDRVLRDMLDLDSWQKALTCAKDKALTGDQFTELVRSPSVSGKTVKQSLRESAEKKNAIFDLVRRYCDKKGIRRATLAEMQSFFLNGPPRPAAISRPASSSTPSARPPILHPVANPSPRQPAPSTATPPPSKRKIGLMS